MKKIIIVCSLLALCAGIKAQTAATTPAPSDASKQNCGFINVFGGMTIPSGNWTNTAYVTDDVGAWLSGNNDNQTSGFSGNGNIFGVEGAWFFSKYVGVGALISHSYFSFKGLDSISAGYRSSFDVDQVTTTVTGGWNMWNFMTGFYFRYPFSDKFSVTAKVLGGFASATTPTIAVDVEDGGVDDGVFTQQPSTANSFSYMAGIGVSYNVMSCMSISLQGNYFSSQPDFLIDNTNRNINAGRLLTEYNQPLTAMSISLGVSYLIGTK